MAKFPLEEVSRRRLTDGADIDSSKIRIVGVDEDVRDETEGLQPPEDPTGAEYRAFSENPVKFIKSHPAGIRYLTMMRQILANGGTDNPLDLVSVTIDGVRHWYVDDGRTRAVIDRVLGRLIRGEIEIPMLAGALDEARAKYKYGTLDKDQKIIYPILRGRSVDPQVGNDPEERRNRAFRQNTTRKGLDDAAKYRAACDDFRAAERREVAPNYQQIADNATMELPTIKSWHRLYKMPKQVQDRVWEGAISINAVLKFAGGKYTDEERIAQVEAMIAAGATSVRDAIATHRAASGGSDSTVDDEPRGDGDGGKRSQGDSERVERESTDAVTGSGTPRVAVKFADKPLGAKFVDEYAAALADKPNQHENLALACMKLASKGWGSLNKRERDAIEGVSSLYKSVEGARRAAAAKAKKAAEARAKVNAPADPNAESLIDASK